jgi:hypothetical protein
LGSGGGKAVSNDEVELEDVVLEVLGVLDVEFAEDELELEDVLPEVLGAVVLEDVVLEVLGVVELEDVVLEVLGVLGGGAATAAADKKPSRATKIIALENFDMVQPFFH